MPLHPLSSLPPSVFALHLLPLLFSLPKDRQPVTVQKCLKTEQAQARGSRLQPGLADTGVFQPPPDFYWGKNTYYRE